MPVSARMLASGCDESQFKARPGDPGCWVNGGRRYEEFGGGCLYCFGELLGPAVAGVTHVSRRVSDGFSVLEPAS